MRRIVAGTQGIVEGRGHQSVIAVGLPGSDGTVAATLLPVKSPDAIRWRRAVADIVLHYPSLNPWNGGTGAAVGCLSRTKWGNLLDIEISEGGQRQRWTARRLRDGNGAGKAH